jgi:hypothetical protein
MVTEKNEKNKIDGAGVIFDDGAVHYRTNISRSVYN